MTRKCEDCGAVSDPYQPRTRVGDRLLCAGCAKTPRGGLVSSQPPTVKASSVTIDDFAPRLATIQTEAHDSGDGMTIFHCPFCGSGQVLARSDRTTECQFCHTCFTVQVQPEFSAFPQTVDGQPMQVPGMPGDSGPPPVAPGGDPDDPDNSSGAPPFGNEGDEDPDDEDDAGNDPEAGDDNQVFASRSYQTATGALLSEDDFIKHLAIRHAENKALAVQAVKATRTASEDVPHVVTVYAENGGVALVKQHKTKADAEAYAARFAPAETKIVPVPGAKER